jgi:hypothetical protein
MEELDDEQRLIRRYLMGQPGPERELVEERMLADPDYFDRVLMEEEALFEDFVFGDMSAPERESFTEHLLLPPRQLKKLEITRALKNYSETTRDPAAWWIVSFTNEHKLGAAFALAALLLLGSFAGYRMLARDPLEKELARLNSQPATSAPPGQTVNAVTLTPTLFRGPGAGDDEKQLTIPPGAEVVLLHLALSGEDYESYNVALARGAGERPLRVEGLRAVSVDGAKVLPVRIPSRALAAGHHELTLSGVAADGSLDENIRGYTFRVAADQR